MTAPVPQCPHKDVRFCPLYHAAHEGWDIGASCDDGMLLLGDGCAVARGLSYPAAVERIKTHAPGYVERIEWAEDIERRKSQRARNMASAGVH